MKTLNQLPPAEVHRIQEQVTPGRHLSVVREDAQVEQIGPDPLIEEMPAREASFTIDSRLPATKETIRRIRSHKIEPAQEAKPIPSVKDRTSDILANRKKRAHHRVPVEQKSHAVKAVELRRAHEDVARKVGSMSTGWVRRQQIL